MHFLWTTALVFNVFFPKNNVDIKRESAYEPFLVIRYTEITLECFDQHMKYIGISDCIPIDLKSEHTFLLKSRHTYQIAFRDINHVLNISGSRDHFAE